MTSEEIYSHIASSTGIARNNSMLHLAKKEKPDKETSFDLINQPLFAVYQAGSLPEEIVHVPAINLPMLDESDEKTFVFNPYAISYGVLIWMVTQPESQITKDLLFCNFNWLNTPTDVSGLTKAIMAEPKEYIKKYLNKYGHIIGGLGQRRRRPIVNRNLEFDIDVRDLEYGTASYSVNRYYRHISFSQADLDQVREADDDEEAIQILQDLISQLYNEGDADDWGDYDYDSHNDTDHEGFEDNTDYDELLSEIRENG